MGSTSPSWQGHIWGKVLSGILALAILGALGLLGYFITTPREKGVTEFYLLGLSGEAGEYPAQLAVGQAGKVVVGIVNREYKTMTYHLEITISGKLNQEIGPMILGPDEKWEAPVGFTPERAGDKQKVEFLLYRPGQSEVYRSLYLWLDVR